MIGAYLSACPMCLNETTREVVTDERGVLEEYKSCTYCSYSYSFAYGGTQFTYKDRAIAYSWDNVPVVSLKKDPENWLLSSSQTVDDIFYAEYSEGDDDIDF